jgi:hypothetical protein
MSGIVRVKVRGSRDEWRPEEIQSVRLSDADKVPGVYLPTYLDTYSTIHGPSSWRTRTVTRSPTGGPALRIPKKTPKPSVTWALADANFEKLTNGLGAQSDDATAFQMPSDLPLRCRTLSLVTHSDDC